MFDSSKISIIAILSGSLLLSACGGPINSSSSSAAVSSSQASSRSISSSSVSSASSSSLPVASNETLPQSNQYEAHKAPSAPIIDGQIDPVWAVSPWQAIDVRWLGAQQGMPSASDYSGRYKVIWDEQQIYLLMDITDDVIFDHDPNPLSQYWIDDTVELFIDEDHSGGGHEYNNFANAWAYHISTYKDVVDTGLSGVKLFNDHVTVEIHNEGTRHIWEMSIRIYGDDYDDQNGSNNNTPLTLYAGKTMGFSACYIDNDNSIPQSSYERESMMGSVNTQGHKDNLGYQNADVFGTMTLVE